MLDLVGLPKNANGFRTTHTCELCGFEPKTKNKYREKQDHLVMKHFKERIDKIFPHCRPYTCPNIECDFTGKDKQALLRHYTGKHGILELYLREALAEKGIQYHLSDSAKRKSMGTEIGRRAAKEARVSSDVREVRIETILPDSGDTAGMLPQLPQLEEVGLTLADTTTDTHDTPLSSIRLPSVSTVLTRPTPEQIKKEVEAMMASLEPVDTQVVFTLPQISCSQSMAETLPLDSSVVSSTTPDCLLPLPGPEKVLNDPGIMWGGGGPSVLVESAQSVPVQYIDTTDPGFVNLADIDYDYLYPATVEPSAISSIPVSISSSQERQLSFSML